jgi:hypothetical protein
VQLIQNTLVPITTSRPFAAFSSELIYYCHWLPVYHHLQNLSSYLQHSHAKPASLLNIFSIVRSEVVSLQAKFFFLQFTTPHSHRSVKAVPSAQLHPQFGVFYHLLSALLFHNLPFCHSATLPRLLIQDPSRHCAHFSCRLS